MNKEKLCKIEKILKYNKIIGGKYSNINQLLIMYEDEIKDKEELFSFAEKFKLTYKNIFHKLDSILKSN